jgi:hypothetical protein
MSKKLQAEVPVKNALRQLSKQPDRDKNPGAHALNVMFARSVGPWSLTSANDERFEITYSESWGITLRHRADELTVGIPWANVTFFEPRKDVQ